MNKIGKPEKNASFFVCRSIRIFVRKWFDATQSQCEFKIKGLFDGMLMQIYQHFKQTTNQTMFL